MATDADPAPRCDECGEEMSLQPTGAQDEQGEPEREWTCVTVTCPGSGVI